MTIEQLDRVMDQSKYRNYIPPVSAFDLGWEMYFHGKDFSSCRDAAQRAGYKAAQRRGTSMLAAEYLMADIEQIAA